LSGGVVAPILERVRTSARHRYFKERPVMSFAFRSLLVSLAFTAVVIFVAISLPASL
jgi:hypothetical protein